MAARSYETHEAWEAAAVALAQRHGMGAGGARFYVSTWDGKEVYRALSRQTWRYEYEVVYSPHTDRVESCDCPAHGACHHVGSVRLWVERRKGWVAAMEVAA